MSPHVWCLEAITVMCLSRCRIRKAVTWRRARCGKSQGGLRFSTFMSHNYTPEILQLAPENRLGLPKRKGSSSNYHFAGAMLNFGGVDHWEQGIYNLITFNNFVIILLHVYGCKTVHPSMILYLLKGTSKKSTVIMMWFTIRLFKLGESSHISSPRNIGTQLTASSLQEHLGIAPEIYLAASWCMYQPTSYTEIAFGYRI